MMNNIRPLLTCIWFVLELETQLAAKEAFLLPEPSSDGENVVNLLSLFDFIDIGRVVKPGSYRLVSEPVAFRFASC
ncbi:hypothetical protein Lal_00047406 [Lupinus albus]|nr:hypothetical protein Lal_00047406 [Lupinus albus]